MRKIEIQTWKVKSPEGKDMDESLVEVLNVLISMKKPEDMPKGFDNFRLMNRLAKALDRANETKVLILEEADYSFLKNSILKEIPAQWGANKNISQAVEEFMSCEETSI